MSIATLQSKKLNLGCGNVIIPEWVNADKFNPRADIKADALDLSSLPSDWYEEVLFNHVIEHIPYRRHTHVFEEIHRIMAPGGKLSIGYPEWAECAKAFIENKNGERWSWWIQTLYGSQTDEGQFHHAPVVKDHLMHILEQVGFHKFTYALDRYNAFLTCIKTEPMPWFTEEIWSNQESGQEISDKTTSTGNISVASPLAT